MPVIRIDFDNEKVTEEEVVVLSEAARKIIMETTNMDDVMVYANSAQIKIHIHPIEIFIQLSSRFVTDVDALVLDMKNRLSAWKTEAGFKHLINFTFIPMDWKIEIGI